MPFSIHTAHRRLCRRRFVGNSAALFGSALMGATGQMVCGQGVPESRPAFVKRDKELPFDTGVLRGTLRSGGRSLGLTPMVVKSSNTPVAGKYGLVSHYRLLDSGHRFGTAGWDWASTAHVLKDGGVRAEWSADQVHPFRMQVDYRWVSPCAMDVTTAVTPRRRLHNFEVFLASYFAGFDRAQVYVQHPTEQSAGPGFMEAIQSGGVWQMYPRDKQAVALIGDGRWQRPPHPVAWQLMPQLELPLALRRDEPSGLVGLLMAPREDCFAISTPYGAEGHRSLYLSLFGYDVAPGQTVVARARLVIGHDINDDQALAIYQKYCRSLKKV